MTRRRRWLDGLWVMTMLIAIGSAKRGLHTSVYRAGLEFVR
jgi:hypothetical protein